MGNIFTSLISILNTVSVRGEHDINAMKYALDLLRKLEQASNAPEPEEEGKTDGR